MTTAKNEVLMGYNLKAVIQWGQWTFGGGSLLGGTSLYPPSRENPV